MPSAESCLQRIILRGLCRPLALVATMLVVSATGQIAVAQPPAADATRQASFEQSARPFVRFAQRSAEVGDQVEQTISIELRMKTTTRQGAELLEQTQSLMRNQQHRLLTTTDVAGGRAMGVKLRYVSATKAVQQGEGVDSAAQRDRPAPARLPVDGKAYVCHRSGDQLTVTDSQGAIPPLAEYEIVAQHMEMLGEVNPLTQFLAGRTIHVGQRVSLPIEVARRLLGFGDELGDVTRFDLVLQDIVTDNGRTRAVFQAEIEAASNDSSQMRLQMSGPMIVEADTCRAVRVELAGPIGMSETRGSYSHTYYLVGTGRMAVRLDSLYRDVRR